MDEKENILQENIEEYYTFATDAFKKQRYNTATTLFFKALAATCDLIILKNEGIIPSSHSDRFRILETKHQEVYNIIDRDFPFYQDSYTTKMNKEAAEMIKNDVERLAKKFKITLKQ